MMIPDPARRAVGRVACAVLGLALLAGCNSRPIEPGREINKVSRSSMIYTEGQFRDDIQTIIDPFDQPLTLDQYFEAFVATQAARPGGIEPLREDRAVIDGIDARWITYAFMDGSVMKIGLAYLFIRDMPDSAPWPGTTLGYTILCSSDARVFSRRRLQYEYSVRSFRYEED